MCYSKRSFSFIQVMVCCLVFSSFFAASSFASGFITYNGHLLDDAGNPVSGVFPMNIRIYDSVTATPSEALWSSDELSVKVSHGYFSVVLGEPPQPAFPEDLFSEGNRYFGVTVEGVELTPRKRVTDVPRALNAGSGVPSGTIIMWFGDINQRPNGWIPCDGSDNRAPNLSNRFIVAAGSAYPYNTTGGSRTHTHAIPGHQHYFEGRTGEEDREQEVEKGSNHAANDDHRHNFSGTTHTAGAATVTGSNIPPYHALHFLMKE